MTDAYRDQNHVPVKLAVSNTDSSTTLPLQADPTNHMLSTDDGVTGSPVVYTEAIRDSNHVPVMMAVSSVDGVTPVPLVIDSVTGKLLIQSS